MEKLVVVYNCTDGYTYWSTQNVCIEYESKVALEKEIEKLCNELINEQKSGIYEERGFKGIDLSNFISRDYDDKSRKASDTYNPPSVFTLEEWWDYNKEN